MTGFLCHCSNTGVERTPNNSQHTKLILEKKILPPLPLGFKHECGTLINKLSWLPFSTLGVVYFIWYKININVCYVGSTKNLKLRWACQKSDAKLEKVKKCSVANHIPGIDHLNDRNLNYLLIFGIKAVSDETGLLRRETWWQWKLGTIFKGLNVRKDTQSLIRSKNRTVPFQVSYTKKGPLKLYT